MEKRASRNAPRRTETVSIRLEPRVRYLAELAARQQRRTISSYSEWAIEESLKDVVIGPDQKTVADMGDLLWDFYEPDRFVRLAFHYPHLLTHEEQHLWKLIVDNNIFWEVRQEERAMGYTSDGRPITGLVTVVTIGEKELQRERLRMEWDKYLAVVRGQASEDILPKHPIYPVVAHIGARKKKGTRKQP